MQLKNSSQLVEMSWTIIPIDKLCRINADYKSFINKATSVLNAQKEFIEDVKGGLQKFCDKGFDTQEEVIEYCNKHHIPC